MHVTQLGPPPTGFSDALWYVLPRTQTHCCADFLPLTKPPEAGWCTRSSCVHRLKLFCSPVIHTNVLKVLPLESVIPSSLFQKEIEWKLNKRLQFYSARHWKQDMLFRIGLPLAKWMLTVPHILLPKPTLHQCYQKTRETPGDRGQNRAHSTDIHRPGVGTSCHVLLLNAQSQWGQHPTIACRASARGGSEATGLGVLPAWLSVSQEHDLGVRPSRSAGQGSPPSVTQCLTGAWPPAETQPVHHYLSPNRSKGRTIWKRHGISHHDRVNYYLLLFFKVFWMKAKRIPRMFQLCPD